LATALWASVPALGHFLAVVPEADFVKKREVKFKVEFTHPAEGGPAMPFEVERATVYLYGKFYPVKLEKKGLTYEGSFKVVRPGVYQLVVEQKPYWEESEGLYIKQVAKVFVDAYGWEEGWDRPVGLKVEVVPQVRPFGLWEGNTFVGRVYKDGKPLAGATVEVEYYNDRGLKYPVPVLTTQTLKTDERGYFYYTLPWSGWWGFSVLTEGQTHEGKPLELDAVLWIYAHPKPEGVR